VPTRGAYTWRLLTPPTESAPGICWVDRQAIPAEIRGPASRIGGPTAARIGDQSWRSTGGYWQDESKRPRLEVQLRGIGVHWKDAVDRPDRPPSRWLGFGSCGCAKSSTRAAAHTMRSGWLHAIELPAPPPSWEQRHPGSAQGKSHRVGRNTEMIGDLPRSD
jgi:hypothetical protein